MQIAWQQITLWSWAWRAHTQLRRWRQANRGKAVSCMFVRVFVCFWKRSKICSVHKQICCAAFAFPYPICCECVSLITSQRIWDCNGTQRQRASERIAMQGKYIFAKVLWATYVHMYLCTLDRAKKKEFVVHPWVSTIFVRQFRKFFIFFFDFFFNFSSYLLH